MKTNEELKIMVRDRLVTSPFYTDFYDSLIDRLPPYPAEKPFHSTVYFKPDKPEPAPEPDLDNDVWEITQFHPITDIEAIRDRLKYIYRQGYEAGKAAR
jgi:hypothetical protein